MRLTWDERKNHSNATKHGISFETTALVFDDPQAQNRLERIVEGEERWQTIGSVGGVLSFSLLIPGTKKMAKNRFTLFPPEKATARERTLYEESF